MNKKVIILTIFIIMGMISIPTIYKIYTTHNNNLLKVVEKEFLYQAKLCYNENNCEEIVSLKDLYNQKYLTEKLTNPITKKYYEENSTVNIKTYEINLIS